MAVAAPGQLNLDEVPLWGSRGIDCFQKLEEIGQGTHGHVYMAKEMGTGEIVAVKKIIMAKETGLGFPIPAIREIKILQKLNHRNVIQLKEIVTSPGPEKDEQGRPVDGNKYKGSIYMVFDYMEHDLLGLSKRPGIRFSIPQIKCYMRQLLTGLYYCHVNKVLHRDIKSANLLIDNEGNLKLADFGLARVFSGEQDEILTNCVITLWYRPPELLLGSIKYGPEVDMWSVGCIFAELLDGNPIFPGKNELNKIFELCGTPDESNRPGVTKMPWYNKLERPMKRRIGEAFKHFDHYALDLLEKMLTLDPENRISEKDALDAEYFWTDPLPCDPKSLPKYESSHEFQTKKKHQQQRQQEAAAKRQKLSHPPPNTLLPSIHPSGLPCPPTRSGPNQPLHGSQPPMAASGPSHHYNMPLVLGLLVAPTGTSMVVVLVVILILTSEAREAVIAGTPILLSTTPHKNNCLHIAAMLGHHEFAKEVWSRAPSLFSGTNIDGETPLIASLMAANLSLASDIITAATQYMQHDDLEEGRPLNLMLLKVDRRGESALHHAMRNGFENLALQLLEIEPRLSEQVSKTCESPMYMAARKGYSRVVERLLEIPSSADSGPYGESVMHAAVKFGHTGIVKQLLEGRPQLAYCKDKRGGNPLHRATLNNNLELVKIFLEYDPNLAYTKHESELTPFIIAAQKGYVSIAKEIMSTCPDSVYTPNNKGESAE